MEGTVGGIQCLIARTGYTGEPGVELIPSLGRHRAALRRAAAQPRARRRALRPRRARHPAARGLLPAARQRHHARDQRDRGGPRLGLRARQGLHRRRRAAARQGRGARSGASWRCACWIAPSRARAIRCSTRASRSATVTSGTLSPSLDRGIGLGYLRADLAAPGTRRAGRRPRARARTPRSRRSRSTGRRSEHGGRGELPGRPPLPPGARLGADRRGRGRLRDHLVRPGRARRGRVLRAARGVGAASRPTRRTASSSP